MSDAIDAARDRTIEDIERELNHRLDLTERIAVTNALESFAAEVKAHTRTEYFPW